MDRNIFILPDRRRLCYAEYGEHTGFPIVYCHGFPASRLEAQLAQTEVKRQGVRLISIDRPGFGRSDFMRNRSILDWPEDVRALLNHLRIDKFSVIGVSGGAPYAMSCAYRLRERISKLGLVCGLGWLGDKYCVNKMRNPIRLFVKLFEVAPKAGDLAAQQLVVPFWRNFPAMVLSMIKGAACANDKKLLCQPHVGSAVLMSLSEALSQGGKGPAWEFALYAKPWGFDLRDINVETYLWHGDNDNTVPLIMSQRHAAMIPYASLRVFPGEGHFTVPIRHAGEILRTLCE